MNVLVIAPHPDDEAIGCGGSICLHARRGDRVAVVFLTSGEMGLKHLPAEEAWRVREAEAGEAAKVLGVDSTRFLRLADWFMGDTPHAAASALAPVLSEERPDLVYVPHPGEWHPDHKASLGILIEAERYAGLRPRETRTYEVWTPLSNHEHVEDISGVMRKKLAAVRCYASQLKGIPYDRAVRGLNRYRGVLAGRCRYAEVFGSSDPADGGTGGGRDG